ncbi:phage tail tube protein [Phycisphaerales bacterium AB-hyl4]|uniref:Phage tail tube protein n=1 Tax=Natronomicrosphaera hydrolytica TaxID=3242702 RepID=A0ABV4U5R9_9BACT
MPRFKLGRKATLHYGDTDGETVGSLTEAGNVKDVTVNLGSATADATTRDNGGWRATAQTLKEAGVEFSLEARPGDDFFETLRDAYLSAEPIGMKVLDGPSGDGDGPVGDWVVTDISRSEELEGTVVYSVTCAMSRFEEWEEATAA